jgi:hypothetical protein
MEGVRCAPAMCRRMDKWIDNLQLLDVLLPGKTTNRLLETRIRFALEKRFLGRGLSVCRISHPAGNVIFVAPAGDSSTTASDSSPDSTPQ